MERLIYWAAPLHDMADQMRNIEKVDELRKLGHRVYLPQEHGVWTEFKDPEAAGFRLYTQDIAAMQIAQCAIAYCGDRAPSEGMLFEIGWMRAANKPVYLLNDKDWHFGLMITHGVTQVFESWEKLLEHLASETFAPYDAFTGKEE